MCIGILLNSFTVLLAPIRAAAAKRMRPEADTPPSKSERESDGFSTEKVVAVTGFDRVLNDAENSETAAGAVPIDFERYIDRSDDAAEYRPVMLV